MHFIGKEDGPSIEELVESRKKPFSKKNWKLMLPLSLKDDAKLRWQSLDHAKMMTLFDEAFEKVLLNRWSHVGKLIQSTPKVYFHLATPYYRSMDKFNKRRLLFLLTLVANKKLSISIGL
jgi:hypothetical protein